MQESLPAYLIFYLGLIFFICLPIESKSNQQSDQENLSEEDKINLFCLRKSYPQIKDILPDDKGILWLIMHNGKKVAYSGGENSLMESMRQTYPLEPERPDTVYGISPGRIRPYAFWNALYGSDPKEVTRGLVAQKFLHSHLSLTGTVAKAFENAKDDLEKMAREGLMNWLKPNGGYCWRKIAGENRLSAHSFGIALDLGANAAPYWRWNKITPHPLQKTYPSSIVQCMEKRGFIWGGKWHEYDLMHFEYRPELICKSQIMRQKLFPDNLELGLEGEPELTQ